MFKKPTVIVVGAGASAECNLPAGEGLKRIIADGLKFRFGHSGQVSGDPYILSAIKKKYRGDSERINQFTRAGNELSGTIETFPSIDEALHWWRARPEIVALGKAAIAHYILVAERESTLAVKQGSAKVDIDDSSEAWLKTFLSISLAASDRESAITAFDNVTFVNFNYDRTIEQYLYWGLQQRAGVSQEVAASAVARLKMIRPYGSIGKLDFAGGHEVAFGDDAGRDIFSIAENIRTFTEQSEQFEILNSIDEALEESRLVLFLGFGFHQQNLALFRVGEGKNRGRPRSVLATSRGIDPKNYDVIKNSLDSRYSLGRCSLLPITASQLLIDMRPTITIAVS
jgi:hypothetical protein